MAVRAQNADLLKVDVSDINVGDIPRKAPARAEASIKVALRNMGHYFELDSKAVEFYIRQSEISGKL